ncbi:hypothetical protein QBC39DRAFT_416720 [Podospora conica]|nr:hypothetical protein QBC39DRAFT_416720 [Schizothecium conicum]
MLTVSQHQKFQPRRRDKERIVASARIGGIGDNVTLTVENGRLIEKDFIVYFPSYYYPNPTLKLPPGDDNGSEIDVAGFVFLYLASYFKPLPAQTKFLDALSFKPPPALTKFLDAGDPPIYIGFGSIVVDDANRFTEIIFKAGRRTDAY